MSNSIKLITIIALLQLSLPVFGQSTVLEGNLTRKVIPYPNLREADVMWARRIWQVIDLRQKINHPLYFPLDELESRKCLFEVIRIGLMEDESITAYSLGPTQTDDEFRYNMGKSEIDSLLNPMVMRSVENPVTGEKEMISQKEPLKSSDIIAYKIKEDWLFDKQRSEIYVRIIGIAPVITKYSESGEVKGTKELFWLYYPECRYIFNNYDVFNAHNGARQMSFDELFQKRMFHGYIVKEDNVYNRRIDEYTRGIDALLESERIKNDLFIMEHDLWSF